MKEKLVIGLDIGTTSAKAVVFNRNGKVFAQKEAFIKTYYPTQGWAEQNPKEVEAATKKVIKEVIASLDLNTYELVATGFSTAMHSLIFVDESKESLSNMLLWSDGRASDQAKELEMERGEALYARTGTPIHPMTPLTKLIWMKEQEDPAYNKAAYVMTLKEYLIYRWFDERVVDYAIASSTGLFDVKKRMWDQEALELAGITESQLSAIVEPTYELAPITSEVQAELGIPDGPRFIIGSADGQLANLGSGATSPGEVNISVGTSGAIRQFVEGAPVNDKMETFTYAFTKENSIIGGPTNNGGIVLQWYKDLIQYPYDLTSLIKEAEAVPPGANGILFLPYVNGERAPLWNQLATGNFYGLQIEHTQADMTRALLEGIAFNLYQISQSLTGLVGKPKKITLNGGLTQSRIWVQMVADIFGEDLYVSETHYNAAWGAAWVALVATKEADSFEAIKAHLPKEQKITMNPKNHEIYQGIFAKYERLSKTVSKLFNELG